MHELSSRPTDFTARGNPAAGKSRAREIGAFPLVVAWLAIGWALPIGPTRAQEQPVADQPAPVAAKPVDFVADIQPIFAAHCLKCHGPEKRSGGLRLDSPDFATSGGDSGKPILHGRLETNELYRRVSSSERTYRMPKNTDPLSAQEIERIKQWVEQGTPWPVASATPRTSGGAFYEAWLNSLGAVVDRYSFELAHVKPYAFVFLFAQLALLLVARSKVAFNNHRPWTLGRARSFCRFCSQVTAREMGFAWLLTLAAATGVVMWSHQQKLETELAKTRMAPARPESAWSKTIYGFPPVPIRPDHPKQVAGTYYRGNCERNPALFNNGNYLTAIFHIQLCDSQRKAVQIGDEVPDGGLSVRVEIERAPGTADALFSKELMDSVFFSERFYLSESGKAKDQPLGLETLEDAKRWVVYFPIGSPDHAGKLEGLIYIYTGRVEDNTVRGEAHYGIRYTLAITDGKLAAESDLWMNSFGNSVVALPEPPGKIPYREWFDYRPLPVITGENSTDPKLLGVEEYVKKGLIKPPAVPPRRDAPEGEPAPQNEE